MASYYLRKANTASQDESLSSNVTQQQAGCTGLWARGLVVMVGKKSNSELSGPRH